MNWDRLPSFVLEVQTTPYSVATPSCFALSPPSFQHSAYPNELNEADVAGSATSDSLTTSITIDNLPNEVLLEMSASTPL